MTDVLDSPAAALLEAAPRDRRGTCGAILAAALSGMVLAAWLGLVEAAALCLTRNMPEQTLFLRRTITAYALFGMAGGAVWGALAEFLLLKRRTVRRAPFYLVSLLIWLLLFEVVVQAHGPGNPWPLVPGKRSSLIFSVAATLVAVLLVALTRRFCVRAEATIVHRGFIKRRWIAASVVPLLAVAALPTLQSLWRPNPASEVAGLPNVLLIVMDTTRADHLSACGYDRPTTPTLEQLAAEGSSFRRAYAASPWTLPSHASIFTGRYPSEHGATREHPYLDSRLPTLAEQMTRRGYTTVAFARKSWLKDETGVMRGFEQFFDLYVRSTTALVSVYRYGLARLHGSRGDRDKGAMLINGRFTDWMNRNGDRPFFAFINYDEAHEALRPPSPYRERFLGEKKDTPWGRERDADTKSYNCGYVKYTDEEMSIFRDLYDAEIAYQDARMGEVFDDLRRRGLLDKTLVIVTSDHGENFGDHGLMGHRFCVYNSLLHVPVIVRLPGVVPVGESNDLPVEIRLLPALIERVLAGAKERGGVIPIDRLALTLREKGDPQSPILAELYRQPLTADIWRKSTRVQQYDRRLRAMILGDLKYIWASDGTEELYDLQMDPGELRNLAGERPEDVRRLADVLDAKLETLDIHEQGAAPEFSKEMKKRLISTGYIEGAE